MVEKVFGDAGNRVVIEERKYGTEISFFAYLDGNHCMPLKMFAQDYKPAFDPEDSLSVEEFGGNLNTGRNRVLLPAQAGKSLAGEPYYQGDRESHVNCHLQ